MRPSISSRANASRQPTLDAPLTKIGQNRPNSPERNRLALNFVANTSDGHAVMRDAARYCAARGNKEDFLYHRADSAMITAANAQIRNTDQGNTITYGQRPILSDLKSLRAIQSYTNHILLSAPTHPRPKVGHPKASTRIPTAHSGDKEFSAARLDRSMVRPNFQSSTPTHQTCSR